MAWAATHSFTTGEVVTAAVMNVISGDLDGLNTRASGATIATSQTRTNATYGDLATVGPTVTVTTGTFAVVSMQMGCSNNTNAGSSFAALDVSGATTISASAEASRIGAQFATAANAFQAAGGVFPVTLTAGSNTFTMKYRSGGGDTATFRDRMLTVMPQF